MYQIQKELNRYHLLMASKSCLFFSFFTLILLISLVSHPTSAHRLLKEEKLSGFDFLKHLQGCHKGDKVKGIHNLKNYLHNFGYLSYKNQSHSADDDFDDLLESAVKTYQLNYHLNVTGFLDSETVSKMIMPRCGVADIINGKTRMESGKKSGHHDNSTSFHTVSHFSFFPGNPKWPASKYALTYAFLPGTANQAMNPVSRAFKTWAGNTHFRFSRVQNPRDADIKIGFKSRDHGDGNDFDGRGGTIAHAFAPQDGRFHYDGDEPYAVGATRGAYDFETIALHEIGHLLGLHHSSVEGAIMYPEISTGVTKGLHRDDIQGIQVLYNV
ncbi:metalloendoproteinase 3-MMP-like [Mercurialis annua]|uniref:metalloendoproteinase 3-MMP-like n=1 Tax=Mercurialis annua TaxID=3986 RepID=UPI0024AE695F|nr:metalloendoproteinase 3-MMP-like [Mercurialis annua]